MPSNLRVESSFDQPIAVPATYSPVSPLQQQQRPAKKAKMSLTQTYYVASTARSKLGREAARADHNLRRLVGHANMLDQLMVELSQAEAEQEAWFNQSVRAAGKSDEPRRVQWIDTIAEEEESAEDEDEDEDAIYDEDEDDSDYEDFESEMFNVPLRRLKSPPVSVMSNSYDDEEEESSDEEMEDEEVEEEEHASISPSSASLSSPPELTYDDASDSEEEMPSSPRNVSLELSEKERQAIASYTVTAVEQSEDLVLQRQQQRQPLIAAC